MSHRPYPEYQNSGVKWLGDVPAHWAVQPATAISRVITSTVDKKSYEGEIPVRLCNYTDVYYNEAVRDDPRYMKATATPAQIALFTPRAGDVAITKDSETSDDIGIPAYVPHDMPGVVFGYHLAIYRPKDRRYGRFIKYLFDSKYVKVVFETKTPGVTRVGLSQNTMKYLRLPVPPVQEAEAIVDYLDRETAEIDAFIADQEELIGLLTERRAATITQAVTKGLNSSAPMKDSGIVWASDTPAAWHAVPLRSVASMRTGHTPSRSKPDYWVDCDIPWFTLADVWQLRQGAKYLGETNQMISRVGLDNSAAELLPAGTVVLSRTASVGFSGIMPVPMATSQDYWNWVCGPKLRPEYLWYQLAAMKPFFGSLTQGSTHKTIYQGDAASLKVVLPPISEQCTIAEYLDCETAEIDAAIKDAREAITLSRERRAAVISAAVTGKIDVRAYFLEEVLV